MTKIIRSIFFVFLFSFFLPSFVFAGYAIEVDRVVPRDSKVNVHLYVPSLLVGMLSGDINFKLSDKFALGPQGTYYAYGAYSGYDIGLTANYALSSEAGVFDDRVWLLNPYVLYNHSNLCFDDLWDGKRTSDGVISGLNLIYQWMWNSGINIRAGVGAYYSSKRLLLGIGNSNIGGLVTFSIGCAF